MYEIIKDRKKRLPYLFILPSVIFMLCLYAYPILLTIYQSFFDVSLISNKNIFIGLGNYKEIFANYSFFKTLKITLEITVITVFFKMFFGFLFSLILTNKLFLKKAMRFLILIPWAIPEVTVSILWKWILDGNYGYFNYYMTKFGFINENISWLSEPQSAILFICIIDAWLGISFITITFIGTLEAIPKNLYEAVLIDGANAFQTFIYVTVPEVKKTFITMLILVVIWTFTGFNIIYVLTKGGPMRSTETLVIRIYEEAFTNFNMGISSALSVIVVVILFLVSLLYYKQIEN